MEKHCQLTLDSGPPLDVRRFAIHESLNDLFEVNLFCRINDPDVDLEKIVNHPAKFRLESGSTFLKTSARLWSGVAATAELVKADVKKGTNVLLCTYYVKIVPEIWRLSHKVNHRIFQRKTIPEIVKSILDEEGIKATEEYGRLGKTYYQHDYIVQYGETDYAFIKRLMEREGISYFFRFKGDADTELVLSDHPHDTAARPAITYADNPNFESQQEVLHELRLAHRVAPGANVVRDWDFRRKTDFPFVKEAQWSGPEIPKHEKFYEQYHYRPGETLRLDAPGGDTLATKQADDKGKVRSGLDLAQEKATIGLEADRRRKRTVAFRTNVPDLAPGVVFTCSNPPRDDLGKEILVTDFTIEGTTNDMWEYEGEGVFTAQPYVPDPVTPKPRIHGLQSARVVGPEKQDVWCDEFGRVRVQFQWHRQGKFDEDSSCWLRVSYGWAGTGFGHITIPRINQEVLVAFLEGDPDLPVVVGRVYNQIERIPSENEFPRYATRSSWMSDTVLDEDGGKFNELRFEDDHDNEFVYVQAQKDLQKLVKQDETERTGANRAIVVGNDRRAIVAKSDSTLVGQKYSVQMVAPTDAKALGITDNAKPEVEVLPTKLEMIDKKIFATSGKATLEMEKKEVIFEAKNKISLKAGGNIVVEGGPKILINSGTAGNVAQLGSMSTKQEVAEARNALAARIGLVHGNAEPKESRTWKNTATSVDALAEDAKKAEPTLKSIIADAAEASGGEPNYGPGNAHALKAKDGLRDKVEKRGKPLATISDAVRGTIIVDSPEELGRASEVLTAAVEKAGGKIVYDNKFTYQNPAGYAGLHADVFLPTGDGGMVRSEIQLHLRDINNGKMLNEDPNNPKEKAHALYELSRKPTTPPEQRDALLEQQREIYLTGMQNALARPAS